MLIETKIRKLAIMCFTPDGIPSKSLERHIDHMCIDALKLRADKFLFTSDSVAKKYTEMVFENRVKVEASDTFFEAIRTLESQGYTDIYLCEFISRKEDVRRFLGLVESKLRSTVTVIFTKESSQAAVFPMEYLTEFDEFSREISESLAPHLHEQLYEELVLWRRSKLRPNSQQVLNESTQYSWKKLSKKSSEAVIQFFETTAQVNFEQEKAEMYYDMTFSLTDVMRSTRFTINNFPLLMKAISDVVVSFIKQMNPHRVSFDYKSVDRRIDSTIVNFLRKELSNAVRGLKYVVVMRQAGSKYLFQVQHRYLVEEKSFRTSLGYSRLQMPQIKRTDYDDFFEFLRQSEVAVIPSVVNILDLKPTQKELNTDRLREKIDKLLIDIDDPDLSKPFIISKDGRLLDGHHLYAAYMALDPNREVDVFEVDCGIERLIELGHEYEKSTVKSV